MEHHIKSDERFLLKEGASEGWADQILQAVNDPDTLVLVAKAEGIAVGCSYTIIKSGAQDFGPDKFGYLCDVYVDPDYRRQGIAKRFLTFSVEWLRAKGINMIEASWSVNSDEAKGTWPSLGFEPFSITGKLYF